MAQRTLSGTNIHNVQAIPDPVEAQHVGLLLDIDKIQATRVCCLMVTFLASLVFNVTYINITQYSV
jgi:hypothetical protein